MRKPLVNFSTLLHYTILMSLWKGRMADPTQGWVWRQKLAADLGESPQAVEYSTRSLILNGLVEWHHGDYRRVYYRLTTRGTSQFEEYHAYTQGLTSVFLEQ